MCFRLIMFAVFSITPTLYYLGGVAYEIFDMGTIFFVVYIPGKLLSYLFFGKKTLFSSEFPSSAYLIVGTLSYAIGGYLIGKIVNRFWKERELIYRILIGGIIIVVADFFFTAFVVLASGIFASLLGVEIS